MGIQLRWRLATPKEEESEICASVPRTCPGCDVEYYVLEQLIETENGLQWRAIKTDVELV